MPDLTNPTNAPLSTLLSVTGIGNGSTWAASTAAPGSAEADAGSSACSSLSVSSSSTATILTSEESAYADPGAFSDDEFDETEEYVEELAPRLEVFRGTQKKELNPGARSFVPGKAMYGA